MGEFELIAELFAPIATHPGALGLLDDASVLQVPEGHEAVITKDVMVAGVHFPDNTSPDRVAQKLLRVNLSDLAAMGADPVGYWLGIQLLKDGAEDWLREFVKGLGADQATFGVSLLGGDTVSTPGPIALSLTAMGTVPKGQALKRRGAKPGDRLFVSGAIGDGALGLRAVQGQLEVLSVEDRAYLAERLELPTPRLALGQALRERATATIDISDGLAADANHIADVSGVGIHIGADRVPLSPVARTAVEQGRATLEDLFTGGDDYELLFAVPAELAAEMPEILGDASITAIGEVIEGTGVRIDVDGQILTLERGGFTHF